MMFEYNVVWNDITSVCSNNFLRVVDHNSIVDYKSSTLVLETNEVFSQA